MYLPRKKRAKIPWLKDFRFKEKGVLEGESWINIAGENLFH